MKKRQRYQTGKVTPESLGNRDKEMKQLIYLYESPLCSWTKTFCCVGSNSTHPHPTNKQNQQKNPTKAHFNLTSLSTKNTFGQSLEKNSKLKIFGLHVSCMLSFTLCLPVLYQASRKSNSKGFFSFKAQSTLLCFLLSGWKPESVKSTVITAKMYNSNNYSTEINLILNSLRTKTQRNQRTLHLLFTYTAW